MRAAEAKQNPPRATRIVVVDDHAIMRDGLTAMLENERGLQVVGTAADGKEALRVVEQERPDLVLIDLSMPKTDGASAIGTLKRRHPGIRAVVLTFHKEDIHIHAALAAGADGYVLKDDGRAELLTAIRNVAAGRSYLSPAICDRVVSGYLRAGEPADGSDTPSWDQLTRREREVLKLVAEGYTTRKIAQYLSLSPKTIEKHRANMMRKLGLHSVSAVTAYAIENGLVAQ